MLTTEENQLLARVGKGTPMGTLMRQYWLPFLLSWELEADGPRQRVRLLGEDLVAFRDTSGRVGLLRDFCSHRGASLFYGRNQEDGLRCVYHGWKYDVNGCLVDMPNEPPETNFKDRIFHPSYPCREAAGVIWTYMGPRRQGSDLPPLPDLEWMSVPDDHRILAKRVQFCNWAQAIEGEIDSSHLGFTHSRVSEHQGTLVGDVVVASNQVDRHPRFEVLDTDYGVLIAARRDTPQDTYYYRISQFAMPFWTLVASGTERSDPTRGTRAWIPIDDESVLVLACTFHPLRPLNENERTVLKTGGGAGYVGTDHFLPPTTEPYGAWRPIARKENDYLRSEELQKTQFFSGVAEFWAQDALMQESMGKIYDRTEEHLGTSDSAIIRARKRMIDAARELHERGTVPPTVDNPSLYQVRAAVAGLPKDVPWLEATECWRRVVPGSNPGGVKLGMPEAGPRRR